MQNVEKWAPTKFEMHGGEWRGSRNASYVLPASRLMADRVADAYTSALRAHARGRLLDLGCGYVPLYGAYREIVEETICVDWPNSLHESLHLDYEHNLSDALPLEDQSFDTILLTDVLEHMPYPDRLWAEMRRVLAPGGTLILGVPFMYWPHEAPYDFHRYTEWRLRLFCSDHNLGVVELNTYGGDSDVLADVFAKLLSCSILTRLLVGPMMTAATHIGHRRRKRARLLPLGFLLVAQKPAEAMQAAR